MDWVRFGGIAEDLALAYLRLVGMEPLARHFRAGKAEVDLVMQEGECVVLVEVKYRGAGSIGRGAEVVRGAQMRRLEQAAAAWLMRHGLSDVRFDVVLMDEEPEGLRLRHHRGAFGASGRIPV